MKKLLLFAAAATMFAACSKDTAEDIAVLPDGILRVSFSDDDSRVQLDENSRTVWNEGDLISVFNKTNGNECWRFDGKTGDKRGTLSKVSGNTGTTSTDKVVALYPYDSECVVSGNMISTSIPATQTYKADSFGEGGNILVAVSDDNELQFNHIFGWIRLSLTDDLERKVEHIIFSGNNNEKLAGNVIIDAGSQKIVSMRDNITTITLDCGEGVQLSKTVPTYFYIAVAPQTFTIGVSVKINMTDGTSLKKNYEESFTVTRNHILPIKIRNSQSVNDMIYYTTTDGKQVAISTEGFGANFISNTYVNGQGIIQFDGNITSIPVKAFNQCETLTNVTIPGSVISIGDYAFNNCRSLTDINIPDGVTSIERSIFYGCVNLTNVTMGKYVTSICEWAFYGCGSLVNITIPDCVTLIKDHAFDGCSSLISITIPDNVISIGTYAFYDCSNLTNVTIPNSVTSIGTGAFRDCSSLTSITIPDSITSIGDYTFYKCRNLASVTVPNCITLIGHYAFYTCNNMTSITIPDSVTSIGHYVFSYCRNLANIYCKPTNPPALDVKAFQYVSTSAKIYVPRESVGSYKSASGWSSYASMIEGYDF